MKKLQLKEMIKECIREVFTEPYLFENETDVSRQSNNIDSTKPNNDYKPKNGEVYSHKKALLRDHPFILDKKTYESIIVIHDKGRSTQYYVLILRKDGKIEYVHTSLNLNYLLKKEKDWLNHGVDMVK